MSRTSDSMSDPVHTVTTFALAHGGAALARTDDGMWLVHGALPGEMVRARVIHRTRGVTTARCIEVVDPSPLRIPHRCPAAAAGAGCCDLDIVSPADSRLLTADVVADQLRRIGGFEVEALSWDGIVHPVGADEGWRVRARVGVRDGRIGFRTHRGSALVSVSEAPCVQLDPRIVEALCALEASRTTEASEIIAAVDSTGEVHLREWLTSPHEVRRMGSGKGPGKGRGKGPRNEPTARRGRATRRRAHTVRGRAGALLAGSGTAREQVGERPWNVDATAFWQAHRDAPTVFAQWMARWLGAVAQEPPEGPGGVWDLFGGCGIFGDAVLTGFGEGSGASERRAASVVVETSPAVAGAAAVGLTPARSDVAAWLRGAEEEPTPAVVILDPPRSGAGAEVIGLAAARSPEQVVHVGCDVAAFARDLALWRDAGYKVDRMTTFDAFPGTHHTESLAVLSPVR